ncbi:hypothetical protein HZP71_02225 [Elizabethkingia anophelis]|nr:hypothetical protein [Elizabethkingia anophelis]
MDYYIQPEKIRDYLRLPNSFDETLINQKVGFESKIFPFFPKEFIDGIKDSKTEEEKNIYDFILTAGIFYSFILSIPKLKVNISNYGIENFTQAKTKAAPWWDVRDLGLSLLKDADMFMSLAIDMIDGNAGLRGQLPFFTEGNKYLQTPSIVNEIYSIGKSPEVYKLLLPFIDMATDMQLMSKLQPCSIEQIMEDDALAKKIRLALVYYALYYASDFPNFIFLTNGVAIQYEELPWQKSVVISDERRRSLANQFFNLAEQYVNFILKWVRNHPDDFPCYKEASGGDPQIYKKKSGLYL